MHAPAAVVETDTPNTFCKWLRQQIRWMRGTMVETTAYPRMMARSFDTLHPWVVYTILKTRFLPLATFAAVVQAACTGQLPAWTGGWRVLFWLAAEFVGCTVVQMVFLLFARPNGVGARCGDLFWALPAQLWFAFWFPIIVPYAMCTALDGRWGTAMRAAGNEENNQDGGELRETPATDSSYIGYFAHEAYVNKTLDDMSVSAIVDTLGEEAIMVLGIVLPECRAEEAAIVRVNIDVMDFPAKKALLETILQNPIWQKGRSSRERRVPPRGFFARARQAVSAIAGRLVPPCDMFCMALWGLGCLSVPAVWR